MVRPPPLAGELEMFVQRRENQNQITVAKISHKLQAAHKMGRKSEHSEGSEEAGMAMAIDAAVAKCTAFEPDAYRLKAIKALARRSDDNIHTAARFLMEHFRADNSQVRLMALFVADELFNRSKLFRALWIDKLDKFLALGVGFRKDFPLPLPKDRAQILRSKSLEVLQSWNSKFGPLYRKLRLGYHYLKDVLRIPFPLPETSSARNANGGSGAERDRRARTQEILRAKFETLVRDFEAIKGEIQGTAREIRQCFDILKKEEDEGENAGFSVAEDEFCYEYGASSSLSLRQIREEAISEARRPHENSENEAVFDALRELYRLLDSRHLKTIQDWLLVLMRLELPEGESTSSAGNLMRELIDLRNEVQDVKSDCEKLGCNLDKAETAEDDDVMWEDVPIESCNPEILSHYNSKLNSIEDAANSNDVNDDLKINENSKSHVTEGECSKTVRSYDPLKQSLLEEAPVLQWGPDLETWGAEGAAPTLANQRGLDITNHWGRVDMDAVVPRENAAELNLRATVYKSEMPEILPCNAPLKNGKLCQRRDLRVCPFHGPIVPRDSAGNPVQDSVTENSLNEDSQKILEKGKKPVSPALLDDRDLGCSSLVKAASSEEAMRLVMAQAIANVRSRDESERKRKQADKLEEKRNKLQKIRAHNEEVLRACSIANSVQGLGEAIGEDLEGWSGNVSEQSNKKSGSSSMLKKKPSVKERLAKKLRL